MKCRICGSEIAFVVVDGRQSAVHAQEVGVGSAGVSPGPGERRRLRRELEAGCRALPELCDDVKSVRDAFKDGTDMA